MATFNFNASAIEPAAPRAYQPLPAGSYEMMVTASDVKATKTGTGHYVELEMQVTDGEHSGRRHWERLNIDNPNKQAEEIAKKALAALCLAIGRPDIKDTDELLDTPFTAVVEIDRKDPSRNRIVGYESTQAAPAPTKPATAPGKKPWQ